MALMTTTENTPTPRFGMNVLIHDASTVPLSVSAVPDSDVVILRLGGCDSVSLADTPERLAGLLVAALANLDEHRGTDSLAEAEAAAECVWCGADRSDPECGHDPETGARSGDLAEEHASDKRDELRAEIV